MSNFLGNFALIGTSETWNHIKIFTRLEGCFKNQVSIESDKGREFAMIRAPVD